MSPPIPLISVPAAYLIHLAAKLVIDFDPTVAGRLALSTILVIFVLKGSRIAGGIMGVLCALSALVLLVAAIATFAVNAQAAVIFTLLAGLIGAFAAYLFFSPSVRAFQARMSPGGERNVDAK